MEGSVLSFLKAEWKVSDTDSVHWASAEPLVSEYYTWKPQTCFKCSSMCSEEVVVLFEANKNPRLPPWLLVGRDILEMLPHSYVLHTKSPKWLEILYIWLYITFSSCSLKYLIPIASHKFSSSMLFFFSYFISIYLSPHKIFQDFWFLSSCLW
jgi:hypothetical protein